MALAAAFLFMEVERMKTKTRDIIILMFLTFILGLLITALIFAIKKEYETAFNFTSAAFVFNVVREHIEYKKKKKESEAQS